VSPRREDGPLSLLSGTEEARYRVAPLREMLGAAFGQIGDGPITVARAPGRVNLIGEHTDYNDGFVLPVAMSQAVYIAAQPRSDRQVRLRAQNLGKSSSFSLDAVERSDDAPWSNYPRGVARELQAMGHPLRGCEAVIWSDVPIAAGVSSSAAIELACALAMTNLTGVWVPLLDLALASQRAENQFVGVSCGIMDQFASAFGRAEHALRIDCRSLERHHFPLPAGCAVVVCDTRKPRELAQSAYNERRAQCEAGARAMGAAALRDADLDLLETHRSDLDPVILRRCRHVVTENARVLAATEALEQSDLSTFGRLMNESHRSLRDDYEVSCAELDAMVEAAWEADGCCGARLTGAGFGGCAVALVAAERLEAFVDQVSRVYEQRTGRVGHLYPTQAADGAVVITDPE